MNLSNINILKSKNADYRCIISGIIKRLKEVEFYENVLKVNTKSKYLSFKFTSIVDLEKVEKYRLKKNKDFRKIYENGKSSYKIWWYSNRKTKILPI